MWYKYWKFFDFLSPWLCLLWTEEYIEADRAETPWKMKLLSLWRAAADSLAFLPHSCSAGNCLEESAGLMRDRCADTYIYPTVYSVSVFTLRSTPFSSICTNSAVTSPRALCVYHSYQHTPVITLTARLTRLSQKLNFTDKVLLHGLRWYHHLW